MATRISRQFAAHGETDGIRVANTERWDDPFAVRAFRAAINKDVDSMIVTKGIGDVPLFQHTPLGRTVLQFKSFALASHQRAFMRGLQAAELGVDGGRAGQLAGLMSVPTFGMFIYWPGPTGGMIQTLVNVMNGLKDGKVMEANVNALTKLAPFATLPVLGSVVEYGIRPGAHAAVAD